MKIHFGLMTLLSFALYLPIWAEPSLHLNRTTNELVIRNATFTRIFNCPLQQPGPIEVENRNPIDSEIITRKGYSAYFEFIIDNKLISANDPVWIFDEHSSRRMGNGGTEYRLVYHGTAAPVNGLSITIFQQIFPETTLVREKLRLTTSTGRIFHLNRYQGKPHFIFPQYSIICPAQSQFQGTEIRIASWEKRPITFGKKNRSNHMYYPDILTEPVTATGSLIKGPVGIITNGQTSWLTAYEHASQDDLRGLFSKTIDSGQGEHVNDAMQGVKGTFDFPVKEEDFKFVGIGQKAEARTMTTSVQLLRGSYLENEIIDEYHPYETVWTAGAFYDGADLEMGKSLLRDYLFRWICEKPASREPLFYYNTWGMQRQDSQKPLRGILTYDRIFKEIEYAAELGVDIFVLDDGWEQTQGDWTPHRERLPQGLVPIKAKLDEHGLIMGLWFSPMGIDKTTQRYREHENWIIKDSREIPIRAQWDHPAFDFVGGFFEVFIQDCKSLIDQGCRYMKWDAINTFYSTLANLDHGSDQYSPEEIRARYEYLLPIYVTRAMEILTDYEPSLTIEIDLTEARRIMIGLAPLSQGKFYFINNGATWYNDYTVYRTQSVRAVVNEYAGLIPFELFTFATYPHNQAGCQNYNVNTSLMAGHGFWGNLELLTSEERLWVGAEVAKVKRILPYLGEVNPQVIGSVGDSPEIYSLINSDKSAGLITVFSSEPISYQHSISVRSDNLLAGLNYPYELNHDQFSLNLNFDKANASHSIILLPNFGMGISILSTTTSIDQANISGQGLNYHTSDPGQQIIQWSKQWGKPELEPINGITWELLENDKDYLLKVTSREPDQLIQIMKSKN